MNKVKDILYKEIVRHINELFEQFKDDQFDESPAQTVQVLHLALHHLICASFSAFVDVTVEQIKEEKKHGK